jgi:hypothetical protein
MCTETPKTDNQARTTYYWRIFSLTLIDCGVTYGWIAMQLEHMAHGWGSCSAWRAFTYDDGAVNEAT